MKLYQVIAQIGNRKTDMAGELDYIGEPITLKEAKVIADKMWGEYDKNPNYKYGLIGIEENEYELNDFNELEVIEHIRTICKLENGRWE